MQHDCSVPCHRSAGLASKPARLQTPGRAPGVSFCPLPAVPASSRPSLPAPGRPCPLPAVPASSRPSLPAPGRPCQLPAVPASSRPSLPAPGRRQEYGRPCPLPVAARSTAVPASSRPSLPAPGRPCPLPAVPASSRSPPGVRPSLPAPWPSVRPSRRSESNPSLVRVTSRWRLPGSRRAPVWRRGPPSTMTTGDVMRGNARRMILASRS